MRAINWAYLNFVTPAFKLERAKGLARLFDEYSSWEDYSDSEARQKQWDILKELLEHAYATTSFYKERFDRAGLKVTDVQTPKDYQRLPYISREEIGINLQAMCSRKFDAKNLTTSMTGGTTSTPVAFCRDTDSVFNKTAMQTLFNSWAGLWPGDKVYNLWGAHVDYAANPSWKWRMYDRHLMRRRWAQTTLLDDEVFELYRTQINEFKPHAIYAYPSPLGLLCDYIRRTGRRIHAPKTIICTAEALQEGHRESIQEVFQIDPFEHYGAREFGMIAAECEAHNGMHFHPRASYVDFSRLEGDSLDSGLYEIIVTDLFNHGMPLLRYRVSDCATVDNEPCKCGRNFPRVKAVVGRSSEILHLPNGLKIPGVAIPGRILKVCPEVEKLQIIQETLTDFRLRYVPGPNFSESTADMLRKNIAQFFPDGLTWVFEEVREIERERSGKTRFCISKVVPKTNDRIDP